MDWKPLSFAALWMAAGSMPLAADEFLFSGIVTFQNVGEGPDWVRAADVNGDGVEDLVAGLCENRRLAWYEKSEGDLWSWQEHVIAEPTPSTRFGNVADVDGDGDIDVFAVAIDEVSEVFWYENTQSDGEAWIRHDVLEEEDLDALVLCVLPADLSGDGLMDLAVEHQNRIAWHRNPARPPGDRSVPPYRALAEPVDWEETVVVLSENVQLAAAEDVDGDQDPDLVVCFEDENKMVWLENEFGDGSSWVERPLAEQGALFCSVALKDVDGDGDCDVVANQWLLQRAVWYENTRGDGSSWVEHTVTTSVGFPIAVAAGDVDEDGDVDVVTSASDTNRLDWHENVNGDGSTWVIHNVVAAQHSRPRIADLDGDLHPDLYLSTSTGIAWCANLNPWDDLGATLGGASGTPSLTGCGTLVTETPFTLTLNQAPPDQPAVLVLGFSRVDLPFKGGDFIPAPDFLLAGLSTDANGHLEVGTDWPSGAHGAEMFLQYWIADETKPEGFVASNGLLGIGL